MREVQSRLLRENSQFSNIWVQYSNYRGYHVVITLFPYGYGQYQMVFGRPQDITYEAINTILQNYLAVSN